MLPEIHPESVSRSLLLPCGLLRSPLHRTHSSARQHRSQRRRLPPCPRCAAVAVTYALNVVEPQSAGVGGGGFIMIHLARPVRRSSSIRAKRHPPAPHATCSWACRTRPCRCGGRRSGDGAGTSMALERYGNLQLADVLQPAIKLANDGFAATPRYSAVSAIRAPRTRLRPLPTSPRRRSPGPRVIGAEQAARGHLPPAC